jgi:hypothetical protein
VNDVEALVLAFRADSQALALDTSSGYDEATEDADELDALRELGYDELATALAEERWAVCAMIEIIDASGLGFGGIDGPLVTLLQAREIIDTEVSRSTG